MFEFYYLLKGAMIGFIVSIPVGPVSLLCIRRSLSHGKLQGLVTGLGAVIGDFFYASIAAFGLSFVIHFLNQNDTLFRLIGGVFLIIMSLVLFFRKKDLNESKLKVESRHLGETFGSAFLVDISNPVIILAYLALFSGFGLANAHQNIFSGISLVTGVAIGSACWWLLLIQVICLFRKSIDHAHMVIISKTASVILFIFGLFVLYSTFFAVPFIHGDF